MNGENKSSDSNRSQENIIEKMVMQVASDYLSKSTRELHTEVVWMQGKNKKEISLTTHFTRYDQPVQLPSLGQ
jgi:hypothetical protein